MTRAPPADSQLMHWRQRLFGTPGNTVLTLLAAAVAALIATEVIGWAILDAYWQGTTPQACADKSAACWPFIRNRLDQFVYGLYPAEERWRIHLGVGIGLALALPLASRRVARKGLYLIGLGVAYLGIGVFLFRGGWLGLESIETGRWSGFFLTVVTVVFVLATSLPVAVLLALGRVSKLPLLRAVCSVWVELWRSVPALVVLFVAIIMFPLFMPPGMEIDKLLRALIALAILMSAYLSEAVRGALASLPGAQYEAADALGLSYWQRTTRVILPQALPVALPQITSNFIGLVKETTVLIVIGLFDVLGMVQIAAGDPAWSGPGTSATGYLFVALLFWILCFSLSRYSARMERRWTAYRQPTSP